MKYIYIIVLTYLFTIACSSKNTHTQKQPLRAIEAGQVVVADTMDIAEDKLNGHFFAVTVFTNDSSINGSYDVETIWGFNSAYTTIRMPYGGEHYRPLIQKTDSPYTCIIGFRYDDDTIFRPYYEVQGGREQIKTRYTHSYTLQ